MLFETFTDSHIHLPTADFGGKLALQYLGTAGFVFQTEARTIVVDPFISRPDIKTTLLRPLRSDEELVAKFIPKADDVLVGHSHHDHILDAPEICIQTGARLIGSPDTAIVGKAAHVPEKQIIATMGREDICCGQKAMVRGFPSLHGRVYFNRVSMPGDIAPDFRWPARIHHFRHGLVLNWLVEMEGLRIFHIDSADFLETEVSQVGKVDVLCLCAIGRKWRKNYVKDAIRIFQPTIVIACHWDCFWTPLGGEQLLLPDVDLNRFVDEIKTAGVEPAVLPIGSKIEL